MAKDACDLNRSYGRRIQSKIVKRCPGGIESMPTAEQAMMRMLLVCFFCVPCGSGCLPSWLAGCLCGVRHVGFGMWCVGVVDPALTSAAPAHTNAHTNTLAVAGLWGRQCGFAKCARNDGARDAAGEPLRAQYSKNQAVSVYALGATPRFSNLHSMHESACRSAAAIFCIPCREQACAQCMCMHTHT
jgi:hypothetical protein